MDALEISRIDPIAAAELEMLKRGDAWFCEFKWKWNYAS